MEVFKLCREYRQVVLLEGSDEQIVVVIAPCDDTKL